VRINFKKTIIILPAFFLFILTIQSSPALSNDGVTLHRSAGAMSLRLDKEIYYAGDVVDVYYSHPQIKEEREKGIRYELTIASLEGVIVKDTHGNWPGQFERHNGILRVGSEEMKLRSRISRDFTVILTRMHNGVPTTAIKKRFHLRQPKHKLIAGALSLPKGSRYNYINVPDVMLNLPPSIKHVSEFKVELYYLNAQTRGGAIERSIAATYDYFGIPSNVGASALFIGSSGFLKSGAKEIKMMQRLGFLLHGNYEFRLKHHQRPYINTHRKNQKNTH